VKGETYLVSVNTAGTRTGDAFSFEPLITPDGKRLVFYSRASNLTTNDLNGFIGDVFVFTLNTPGAPVLLKEENSERAIALDSVTQVAGPFPLLNFNNFSLDQRSRISLFVSGLELQAGEDKTAVTVKLENAQGTTFNPTVEYVGDQPGVTGTKQVVIRLPDGATGDLWATVSIRGLTSNRALLKITN